MKRSLVALSLAALAAAGCATPPWPADPLQFDRMLPATPEHEFDGQREYAGAITHTIRVQLG